MGSKDTAIVIPSSYTQWIHPDVVVISFQEGEPLTTLLEAAENTAVMKQAKLDAWTDLVDVFWAMVFKHRFVHGDLHPGNVLWKFDENGRVRLTFIDCGLAIDLRGDVGEDLSKMVKALLTESEEEVGRKLMELGVRVG